MGFTIQNKLEIVGVNKVVVPNCESSSEVSSVTLEVNRAKYCKNSMVDLADVLVAIPEAKVIYMNNTGAGNGGGVVKKFLVLPSGPPPPYGCSGDCTRTDWYQILRDIGDGTTTTSEALPNCETFKYMGCDVSKAFRAE